MGKSILVTQVRSESKLTPKQKMTAKSLGLRGIGTRVVRQDLRAIRGMLNKLHHIVKAELTSASEVPTKAATAKSYQIKAKK